MDKQETIDLDWAYKTLHGACENAVMPLKEHGNVNRALLAIKVLIEEFKSAAKKRREAQPQVKAVMDCLPEEEVKQ